MRILAFRMVIGKCIPALLSLFFFAFLTDRFCNHWQPLHFQIPLRQFAPRTTPWDVLLFAKDVYECMYFYEEKTETMLCFDHQ